jgi:FtsP/CotA-like multicopper oxidase with cupredoxin domain
MSNATSLHWHGMFQNGSNWMDGTTGITQCPVPPGKNFTYRFTVGSQYGTYWWHAHQAAQYIDGLNGPLVIHAPEEAETQKMYDLDQVIMLQDWYHDLSAALTAGYLASGNENAEPVPDNGLIQGTNVFNCSVYTSDSGYDCTQNSTMAIFAFEQGKRYRLRLINTGALTPFQVSVDNHTLAVVEADGTVTAPLPIHRLEVAVAERYSVILNMNQTASNYWFRAEMNENCFAAENPVLNPDVRAILTYQNTTTQPGDTSVDWMDAYDNQCQDLNNTLLSPTEASQAPPADALYQLEFAFQIGANALSRGFINGTQWIPSTGNPTINQAVTGLKAGSISPTAAGVVSSNFSANQYVVALPDVSVVDMLILNFDDGSHPFHFHGHEFWVMATSTEQYFPWDSGLYDLLNSPDANEYTTNPMRRDVITIGPYAWVLLRFRNDNPGMWLLHCHIAWHS